MDKIIAAVSSAPQTRSKNDDDFADRLNSRYTVVVLIVFAIIVTGAAYVGTPITCWAPVHFTGSHTAYANSYCWVRNTYYLPYEHEIPRAHEDDKRQTIYYYQWIPFILLGQAIFFYAPTIVWHGLNSKGGIDADNILESAHKLSTIANCDERENILRFIGNQMDRFLRMRKDTDAFQCDFKHILSATLCRPCGRRFGNYLVLLFLFSKILYIANVIGQMFVLNRILGMKFNLFGFDIAENIMANHDWTEAEFVAFPRVTMCDFDVRRLGNIHRYTIQCTLPINMYNEKIYLFMWFWFVLVAAVSCASFLVWFLRVLMRSDRKKFVTNHLKLGKRVRSQEEKALIGKFVDNYLKQDGAFLLRLIAHNTNNITTTEITCQLWDIWLEKRPQKELADSPIEATTPDYQPPDPSAPNRDTMDDVDSIHKADSMEMKPMIGQ